MLTFYIVVCLIAGLSMRYSGESSDRAFICGLLWPLWLFAKLLQ